MTVPKNSFWEVKTTHRASPLILLAQVITNSPKNVHKAAFKLVLDKILEFSLVTYTLATATGSDKQVKQTKMVNSVDIPYFDRT